MAYSGGVGQAAGLLWHSFCQPYKQNTWFGLVAASLGQSRQFPAWHKVWVKLQELCGESIACPKKSVPVMKGSTHPVHKPVMHPVRGDSHAPGAWGISFTQEI